MECALCLEQKIVFIVQFKDIDVFSHNFNQLVVVTPKA